MSIWMMIKNEIFSFFLSLSEMDFGAANREKKSEIPVYCVIYTRTYVDCWILELKKKLNIKKMWNETNIWIQSTRLEIKSNVKYAIRCRCLWRFDSCFHAFTSMYRFIPIRLVFFALFLLKFSPFPDILTSKSWCRSWSISYGDWFHWNDISNAKPFLRSWKSSFRGSIFEIKLGK